MIWTALAAVAVAEQQASFRGEGLAEMVAIKTAKAGTGFTERITIHTTVTLAVAPLGNRLAVGISNHSDANRLLGPCKKSA